MGLLPEVLCELPSYLTSDKEHVRYFRIMEAVRLPDGSRCPTEYSWLELNVKDLESWILQVDEATYVPDSDVLIIGIISSNTSVVGKSAFWRGHIWGYSIINHWLQGDTNGWFASMFQRVLTSGDWKIMEQCVVKGGQWVQVARAP